MSSTLRTEAAQRLEVLLDRYDWTTQSPSRRSALEAFLRLANLHGFAAVTMRMLATELHIKAPSLYAHFPNGKDEIVSESLRWHFSKFGGAILSAVAGVTSASEFWDTLVRTHLDRQLRLPESNLWDLLVATDTTVHFLPVTVRRDVDELVGAYEALYRACAADLGVELADDALGIVMTMLEGASRWASLGDIDSAADRAVEVSRILLTIDAPSMTRH